MAVLTVPAIAYGGLKLSRAGYESPRYKVESKQDGFEVRRYPAMKVVSTKMDPAADRGQRDSRFMRLFRYIDKGNAAGQKIAMTTPVFMEAGGEGGAMSFVLPEGVAEAGAPEPGSEQVYLAEIEGGRYAALRFRGSRSTEAERKAAARLRTALEKAGLKGDTGAPIFAYYDPPWTPRALRRNEVLIRLR